MYPRRLTASKEGAHWLLLRPLRQPPCLMQRYMAMRRADPHHPYAPTARPCRASGAAPDGEHRPRTRQVPGREDAGGRGGCFR